jgi:hypothetical protein
MPATALIRAPNSEEGEDTRGAYFNALQRLSTDNIMGSHSLFGRRRRLLPAIDLSVAQLDCLGPHWRRRALQPLKDPGTAA